jgi:hypothetical protein
MTVEGPPPKEVCHTHLIFHKTFNLELTLV